MAINNSMFCLLLLLFFLNQLPSSVPCMGHHSPNTTAPGLKCVGCRGRYNHDPPNAKQSIWPDCKKYSKKTAGPEFTRVCNYTDPICYAFRDGSFSGCENRVGLMAGHRDTCRKVYFLGAVHEICYCMKNMCNKAGRWEGDGGRVFMVAAVMVGLGQFLFRQIFT